MTWFAACYKPRLPGDSTLKWMPTWATSLATGALKLLLEQTITATGRIQRPWILTTGQSPLMCQEIGLEHSCQLWSLKARGD